MRFQFKEYAAEAVAFDTASGDTHYLAPLALTLFKLLRDNPGLSRADIDRVLAQGPGYEGVPAEDAQIDGTLESLRRIGLIQPQ